MKQPRDATPPSTGRLKLGLGLQWDGTQLSIPIARIRLAEDAGFDSVWCAEAYGSDALTPLAFIAAHTRRIRLATSIAQVAARTATSCAMQINTLDSLAGGGRAVLGLGMSGPQIVEGWYGVPWKSPYWYMRDYVTIVRKVLRREGPVSHAGRAISLPVHGPDGSGYGKPLKSIMHTNPDIPILLGTGGQAMVTLTAEIADGWLPLGFVPGSLPTYRPWLEEGFRRAGNGKGFHSFHIQGGCQVDRDPDVAAALDRLKPFVAFYVGGMGHPTLNFHKETMIRRGYADAAQRIQELFLAGRRDEAARAVPDEYVDDGALVGPPARIRERFGRWCEAGVQGLTLYNADDEAIRLIAGINREFG